MVTHIWESRWFESMYILLGKTWPTWHMLSTLDPCIAHDHTYLMWSVYSNLSQVINKVGRMYCSQKSAPDSTSQPGWVARGTHLSFSPNTTIKVRLSQTPVDDRLLDLLGPYHQHAIGTFKTCSRGPTHRSLTDIGGHYNLEGAGSPHHTPQHFQPMVLHFPPKGSTRSQVIHLTITNWSKEGTNPTSHKWESPLDFYRNLSPKHSITNGKP
jgi:hypothetical protein